MRPSVVKRLMDITEDGIVTKNVDFKFSEPDGIIGLIYMISLSCSCVNMGPHPHCRSQSYESYCKRTQEGVSNVLTHCIQHSKQLMSSL